MSVRPGNLLNKNEKERPAFIDKFTVLGVEFGDLPPLLMNVKWSPPLRKKKGEGASGADASNADASGGTKPSEDTDTEEDDPGVPEGGRTSFDSDDDDATHTGEEKVEGKRRKKKHPVLTMEEIENRSRDSPETDEEFLFYAACTADLAFRSGIKFTIATQ